MVHERRRIKRRSLMKLSVFGEYGMFDQNQNVLKFLSLDAIGD
jgi:hypothetical protein